MSPVLILALLVLAVIGLAGMVIALLRASTRARQRRPVWPEIAERLGLDPQAQEPPPGAGTLSGRYQGFETALTVENQSRGCRRLRVRIALSPLLDLGLVLGSEPSLREPVPDGATPFATGNPVIDRRLEPRARDPRGARRLFERKALRDRLEAALRRWSLVAVTDETLTLGGDHALAEPPPLDELLGDATAIARLIDEDRPRVKGG
ncbi:MAG TPA: hypothetical protein VM285_00910 [Polyangia bacterium]|nr:hypothetical protein [Polyangia bacterium]